ncbi:hypothetical protein ACFL6M_05240 [Candidatus Eisenbacteria bacterium]|uniref:Uncharacterized protein n=1 Tax=Eiseniibacteriota bacterium TaxID=2212470 RepID=A0ABV6YKX2_UNCEI
MWSIALLPRTSRCTYNLLDAHVLDAALEELTVDLVPISKQVARPVVPRECFDDLLGCPLGSWVCSHVEMQDASAFMGKDEEDEEDLVPYGRDDEEVDCDDVFDVVVQERSPRGGGWLTPTGHVLLDS